jgi:hypothetical protein
LGHFEFFRKFAEIFASKGAPPVSTTPVANFATSYPCVVDTGGKFATSVNDTGGKFAAGFNDTGGKFATSVNDTGGKFAAGFNDTGGKFASGVADTGGKEWEQYKAADTLSDLEGKNVYIC